MTEEQLIDYWASLCDRPTPNSKNWKEMFDKPVAETIQQLDEQQLVEMALPLKEFKRRVDGLRFQLIENWCLCKYCQLYDPDNINFKHWMSELIACMKNLQDFEIKGKISKQKTMVKMLVNDYDYNQARKILMIIRDKFNFENLKDDAKRNAVAKSFTENIDSLIDVLSSTTTSIADYIQNTFKFPNS